MFQLKIKMDSDICNCQDKSNDVKLSADTFSTFFKTEKQSDCLVRKTETVEDTDNTLIKQETVEDTDNTLIKQETFENGSLIIKQEIKKEELFDENEASPDGDTGVSYSNNYYSCLQEVMDNGTSLDFTKNIDKKDEKGNMMNCHDCFDLPVADEDFKTGNIPNVNSSPSDLEYQDQNTFTEPSIITKGKTADESPENNFGTSSLIVNDVQGIFIFLIA